MSKLNNIPTVVIYCDPAISDTYGAVFGPFSSAWEAHQWVDYKRKHHGWGLEFTIVALISPDFPEDKSP